jgi:hypothetical protein
MSSAEAFETVARSLRDAGSFLQVFGSLPAGDPDAVNAALRARFAYLARIVHPDQAPAAAKARAADVFAELQHLRRGAERAIAAGAYDKPIPADLRSGAAEAATVLQSPTASYRLDCAPFATGDFSRLYRARTGDAAARPVIVKIAAAPTDNPALEHEARIVGRFHGAPADDPLRRTARYVPALFDSFLLPDAAGRRFRVNVLPYEDGFVALSDVLAAYPDGLDPRDAAWICRRVLAQTLAAAMAGVVHGALTPDHVLIHPLSHEPRHIGWSHALDGGGRLARIVTRWRDWYPPEVFDKQNVDHRSDLYMAGKTMLRLFGADPASDVLPPVVPAELASVVLRCVRKARIERPHDGRQVLDAFTRVVRKLWGTAYRPLTLPTHGPRSNAHQTRKERSHG